MLPARLAAVVASCHCARLQALPARYMNPARLAAAHLTYTDHGRSLSFFLLVFLFFYPLILSLYYEPSSRWCFLDSQLLRYWAYLVIWICRPGRLLGPFWSHHSLQPKIGQTHHHHNRLSFVRIELRGTALPFPDYIHNNIHTCTTRAHITGK